MTKNAEKRHIYWRPTHLLNEYGATFCGRTPRADWIVTDDAGNFNCANCRRAFDRRERLQRRVRSGPRVLLDASKIAVKARGFLVSRQLSDVSDGGDKYADNRNANDTGDKQPSAG